MIASGTASRLGRGFRRASACFGGGEIKRLPPPTAARAGRPSLTDETSQSSPGIPANKPGSQTLRLCQNRRRNSAANPKFSRFLLRMIAEAGERRRAGRIGPTRVRTAGSAGRSPEMANEPRNGGPPVGVEFGRSSRSRRLRNPQPMTEVGNPSWPRRPAAPSAGCSAVRRSRGRCLNARRTLVDQDATISRLHGPASKRMARPRRWPALSTVGLQAIGLLE